MINNYIDKIFTWRSNSNHCRLLLWLIASWLLVRQKVVIWKLHNLLILELMFYELELGQNAVIETRKIGWVKAKETVDHSSITRWFMIFRSGYKNLDNQTMSGRPERVNSEAVFQAIETNPVSNTVRVSDEVGISKFSVVCNRHDLGKSGA